MKLKVKTTRRQALPDLLPVPSTVVRSRLRVIAGSFAPASRMTLGNLRRRLLVALLAPLILAVAIALDLLGGMFSACALGADRDHPNAPITEGAVVATALLCPMLSYIIFGIALECLSSGVRPDARFEFPGLGYWFKRSTLCRLTSALAFLVGYPALALLAADTSQLVGANGLLPALMTFILCAVIHALISAEPDEKRAFVSLPPSVERTFIRGTRLVSYEEALLNIRIRETTTYDEAVSVALRIGEETESDGGTHDQ